MPRKVKIEETEDAEMKFRALIEELDVEGFFHVRLQNPLSPISTVSRFPMQSTPVDYRTNCLLAPSSFQNAAR